MKVIFLDVDGVLNSEKNLIKFHQETNEKYHLSAVPFDEECMQKLVELINLTKAKIVLSSTWRLSEEGMKKLIEVFFKYNLLYHLIGATPVIHNESRGTEIKQYLNENLNIDSFIIIDDENDMDELIAYLVKTDPYYGLTSEDISKGVKLLTKKP